MIRFEKIIIAITGSSHLLVHAMMLSLPSLIPVIQKEYPAGLRNRYQPAPATVESPARWGRLSAARDLPALAQTVAAAGSVAAGSCGIVI